MENLKMFCITNCWAAVKTLVEKKFNIFLINFVTRISVIETRLNMMQLMPKNDYFHLEKYFYLYF